ncbi:MAG: alkaline phosphatase family protein, partial [Thermoleophilia bacterium]|nr:alkaline phosphatase family protein [Thermoleophilia bacterium]
MTQPLRPVLVLALDGASFDVIRPMAEAGELPNLGAWMREGRSAPLPSTAPPVTFPAWSSFMTGLPPGEHGIFDFTQKVAGDYRLRFVNATDRAGRTLLRRVGDAGGEVLVLGLPATHPPEPVPGLLVSGFEAPVASGTDPRSASDPERYRRIAAKAGPWMRPELDERATASDFHERAVSTLLARIDRKREFALAAIEELRRARAGRVPDLTVVVFSESDTAGHHYFRDHDPRSPRHDPAASPERKDALRAVHRRLDAACGALRAAVGPGVRCVVLSDHGMGTASDKVLHLNRFLAEQGLLARSRSLRGALAALGSADVFARTARDLALAWLPPVIAQLLFRRARGAAALVESRARFGGFDWRRTLAFSEEANTQPGIWINLAGREAAGCVAPEEYEATRDRVIAALESWKLPSGEPVIARALRREAVHAGPFVERAPDIVLELALDQGHGLSLVPTPWSLGGRDGEGIPSVRTLAPDEFAGGRGRGMNGTHRGQGIFIDCGAGSGVDGDSRAADADDDHGPDASVDGDPRLGV